MDVPKPVSSFLMPKSYEINVQEALVAKGTLWNFLAPMKMLPSHAMIHLRPRNI
jgi:hypothetical protein